jgi:glutamate decarboxylase
VRIYLADDIPVDVEEIIERCKGCPQSKNTSPGSRHGLHQTWKRDEHAVNGTKNHDTMPKVGINAQAAYQLLHDETALDGNPLLNVAS